MNAKTAAAWVVLIGQSLVFTGCSSSKPPEDIPHFDIVEPGVWRGGQPTAQGWKCLKEKGVTDVIKLNTGKDEGAEEQGMKVHSYPISFFQQCFGPNPVDKIDQAVRAVTGKSGGVYIHCTHGQDRTGLVVATYLVRVRGLSKEEAREDMLKRGFHRSLLGLDWYWKQMVE